MLPPLFQRLLPASSGGCVRSARILTAVFLTAFPAAAAPAPSLDTVRPFLQANCYDCHADGAKKGGVSFDAAPDEAALLADTTLWHRVLKNVRSGLMPPPDKTQPTPAERQELQEWIKAGVFHLDPAQPDPGRPILRRLNRTEYRNTIRDLTGIDFPVDEEFPADDSGHGFDNIGEVLTVSPMLLEKYLAAAKTIVQLAVPVGRIMPERRIDGGQFHRMRPQDGTMVAGDSQDTLSFYEPAILTASADVAHAGHYSVSFHLSGYDTYVEGTSDLNRCRLQFKVDGEILGTHDFAHSEGQKFSFPWTREWTAGRHDLTVELERLTPDEKPVRSLGLRIGHVTLRGPEEPEHWERPDGYAKWFPQAIPDAPEARLAHAAELLGKFATRAFRRPLGDDTAARLAQLAASVWSQPGQSFESGISRAMEAVLASPRFLFREEFTLPAEPGHPHPLIDEFSLASRLSYFLWSTQPDETLLQLAAAGQLRANLLTQYQRLLADEKSQAFLRNFPGQWLQSRDIEGLGLDARTILFRDQKPDPEIENAREVFIALRKKEPASLTPQEKASLDEAGAVFRRSFKRFEGAEFAENLRHDMRLETEKYFEYIIRENRPLTELIDSGYTFLNERLARHYGVENIHGDQLQKVMLPAGSPRGGVLTQGTVLAVTSNPTRTSPVKRGLFILDNILGTPPPPPPPNIPSLEDANGRSRTPAATLRAKLQQHRADAKCASCHSRMDPLGLAFENFNAMGSWRDQERGLDVDPAGQLVSGEKFTGVRELKQFLVANHRSDFHRCFIEKLLIYALGRSLDYRDETTIDLLTEQLGQGGGRPAALLRALIQSDAFQRRSGAPS